MRKSFFQNSLLFFLLFILFNLPSLQANGTWDGGGDGISWNDPLNWGDDLEPLATDIVTIPANTTIQVSMAGEVAQSIDFTDATSILTILSGDLTLDEGTTGDLIDMPSGGTINISNGGTLRLQNGDNGIDGRDVIVNNSGQLIFDDLDSEAFDIDSGPMMLTNQASGFIQGIAPFSIDFLDIASSADGSIIDNFGRIVVDMNDGGTDFFDINGVTTIRNNVGALIDIDDVDDNVFDFNTDAGGTTFDNFGTIDIFEAGDEGFELAGGIIVTNHSSGIIRSSEVEDELFDISGNTQIINNGLIEVNNIVGTGSVESTDEIIDIFEAAGRFTNNGTITITGVEDNGIIEIDNGIFTNNGIINMGMGFPSALITDEAILLGGGGDGGSGNGQLINTYCGIINITSTNPIEIQSGGKLTNQGIITTVFTGNNEIFGIFDNRTEGIVSAPNAGFFSSPRPLIGSGRITAEPIPANVPLCEIPVPTMGQWALFIFGLLLLNLSLYFLRRLENFRLLR